MILYRVGLFNVADNQWQECSRTVTMSVHRQQILCTIRQLLQICQKTDQMKSIQKQKKQKKKSNYFQIFMLLSFKVHGKLTPSQFNLKIINLQTFGKVARQRSEFCMYRYATKRYIIYLFIYLRVHYLFSECSVCTLIHVHSRHQ